jgi:hypothetical protein
VSEIKVAGAHLTNIDTFHTFQESYSDGKYNSLQMTFSFSCSEYSIAKATPSEI